MAHLLVRLAPQHIQSFFEAGQENIHVWERRAEDRPPVRLARLSLVGSGKDTSSEVVTPVDLTRRNTSASSRPPSRIHLAHDGRITKWNKPPGATSSRSISAATKVSLAPGAVQEHAVVARRVDDDRIRGGRRRDRRPIHRARPGSKRSTSPRTMPPNGLRRFFHQPRGHAQADTAPARCWIPGHRC